MKEVIVYDIEGNITFNFAVNYDGENIEYEVPPGGMATPEIKRIVLRDIEPAEVRNVDIIP